MRDFNNPRPVYINVRVDNSPFEINQPAFYDTLTAEEIFLLEVTVQHEVGAFSTRYKRMVAELIYNRIKSDKFPNTVTGVLFQSGQFQGIETWAYSGIDIDYKTKMVIKSVFCAAETSHDATFYYNPALSAPSAVRWFESGAIEFVFEYTETLWGISYTTRFFK